MGPPPVLARRLLLVAVLAATSACEDDPPAGNALDLGQAESTECVPAPEGADTLFGDTLLANGGEASVTILEVTLVEARDLTLERASFVELAEDEPLVGMRHSSDERGLPRAWEERVPAEGAVLEPGDERNLVLRVAASAEDTASAEATRIVYEDDDGARHEQATTSRMLVTSRPCDEVLEEY